MKVQTKTPITINTGMTTSVTEKLCLEIGYYVYSQDFTRLEVDGRYYYETGSPVEKVIVKHFNKDLDAATIDSTYTSLAGSAETSKHLFDKEIAYQAGLKIMAAEYSIAENDLEIV